MKVYVVLEQIPVILGTTVVSSYDRIRFIGSTKQSAMDFRREHNEYNSSMKTWETDIGYN